MIAWAALPAAYGAGQASAAAPVTFSKDRLKIVTDSGVLTFTIEIAHTPKQLERGLMYRTSLPDDYAMLFYFGSEAPRSMWMKDTPSSLDMLFIDERGRITSIHPHTTPFSTEEIRSPQPAMAVIEMPAGTVAKKGIHVGDRIIHPYFNTMP